MIYIDIDFKTASQKAKLRKLRKYTKDKEAILI